jgi:SNF2 family DNA or RNA helicase
MEAAGIAQRRGSLLLGLIMGSGKSAVAIEAVKRRRVRRRKTCGAVICPVTLKYQWAEEIMKWDPGASIVVIDGDKKKREAQYKQTADYFILGYSNIQHDWPLVRKYLPLDFQILDECSAIKGPKTQRTRRLKSMASAVGLRLALTGTPIENRPEELFSIMEWVDPTVFGEFKKFDRVFVVRDHWGKPVRYKNLNRLHELLGDAMYRKSREDLAAFLPERVFTQIPVHRPYDDTQTIVEYAALDIIRVMDEYSTNAGGDFDVADLYGMSNKDEHGNRLKGEVMRRVNAMRLLLDHPDLLRWSADNYEDESTEQGSEYSYNLLTHPMLPDPGESSAKLDLLLEHLGDIFESDPKAKVVIFATFKPMISIIARALKEREVGYVSMTGDTPAATRQKRIKMFNNKRSKVRVFLSTDAGAYGVNLDSGTHLINYDFPWSAGVFAQRRARIDRTSTEHDTIFVSDLFHQDSVEEYQLLMLAQKQAVADAWIDDEEIETMSVDLDNLRAFLEKSYLGLA